MTNRIDLPLEEILDRCLARILAGESPDDVLRDHPSAAEELRPLLVRAAVLSAVPIPEPDGVARMAAMSRMLATAHDAAERYQPVGVFAWLGSLRARPLAFQAVAAVAAIALLGSAGLGASAATGTTPGPVRVFFRLPDTSDSSVRAHGAVVSASAAALVIDEDGSQRTFLLDAGTSVTRGDTHVTWTELLVGETVDVRATLRADGELAAREVRAKELPASATPDAEGGTSSTNASPLAGTPEARGTEHPDDSHSDRTPGTIDDHGGVPSGSETPKTNDGRSREGGRETEGTPPQADATSTHSDGEDGRGGFGPFATQTPEPTARPESRTPEHGDTPSSSDGGGGGGGGGEDTPKP
jgi:hypothetical protein